MSNKGKKLIHLPFKRKGKYVSKEVYKLYEGFTKTLLPLLAILSLGAFIYFGYIISLVIRVNQPTPDEPTTIVRAYSEPTPTPIQPCYVPSVKTRTLIDRNPGFAGKIKEKYGECEWLYAAELIARESSFNPGAINPTSGACGLSQALPCSKMKCELTDIDCQLKWIEDYVQRRYGSFKQAIDFHNINNWY